MKISARNVLSGKILTIVRGPGTPEGTVESNGGAHVVSSITSSSAEALKLEEGAEACAIIKSSSVMIGVADQVTPGT